MGNNKPCPDCDGDGWQEHLTEELKYRSWLCERCNGTGKVNGLVPLDSEANTDSSNSPTEATQERKEALDE